MPYRETPHTRRRAHQRRTALVAAARDLVAHHGFAGAKVTAVARACGTSVGTVYTYFDNRDELLATVFREAAAHELAAVRRAVHDAVPAAVAPGAAAPIGSPADPAARLETFVATFAVRALRGRRMAWSLLFEPVSPAVEAERLVYRYAYVELAETILGDGVASGVFLPQDTTLSASATIGAISEALVGRLSPVHADPVHTGQADPGEATVAAIVTYCFRALGATPPAPASKEAP